MKFGGTSLGTAGLIRRAARRIMRERAAGRDVVAVVSARGQATDDLLEAAAQVSRDPLPREVDQLLATGEQVSAALVAMAVQGTGWPAVSLTAHQIGILTDDNHRAAKIQRIDPRRIRRELASGRVVVVTGFLAIDAKGDVTTMGRGASDKSAVVLAAVLGADRCEIFTDVKGVYTADPRLVPDARRIPSLSHEEMLEFAAMGAKVMHADAVEWGKRFGVPIDVRSAFTDSPGTRIGGALASDRAVVHGAAVDHDWGRITLHGVPDVPGQAAKIFEAIARDRANVDMILMNVSADRLSDITYTVLRTDLKRALENAKAIRGRLGASHVTRDARIAKLSIVGLGMQSHYGVAARMFRALAGAGINLLAISTSEIKIAVLVREAHGAKGLRALHRAFGLRKAPAGRASGAVQKKA